MSQVDKLEPVAEDSQAPTGPAAEGRLARRRGLQTLRSILRDRQVRTGLVLTLLVLVLALLGPLLSPHPPTALLGGIYGPPSAKAILGYDYLGHDVLSRVLAGGLSVVWMALAASLIALIVGASLGLLAGFLRG